MGNLIGIDVLCPNSYVHNLSAALTRENSGRTIGMLGKNLKQQFACRKYAPNCTIIRIACVIDHFVVVCIIFSPKNVHFSLLIN